VNFVDTAAAYGEARANGALELVLAELGGVPAGYVLATKTDRNLRTGEFSGDQVKRSVERSLQLLRLDRLQLVHLHDPEHTTFEEAMAGGGTVEVLHAQPRHPAQPHCGAAHRDRHAVRRRGPERGPVRKRDPGYSCSEHLRECSRIDS